MIESAKRQSKRSLKSLPNFVLPKSWPVILVLLFGLTQTAALLAAVQQESDWAAEAEEKTLSFVFTDQESGEPVAGVDVNFNAMLKQRAGQTDGRQ